METIIRIIAAVLLAGLPLAAVELIARRWVIAPETSRKLVHVGSSLVACCLPLICNLRVVAVTAACFAVGLAILRRRFFLQSLYRVQRRSWGELFFPLAVCAAALLAPSVGVYVVALLVMGLADTAAAIAGRRLVSPPLPWHTAKTWAGATACFAVSLTILTAWGLFAHGDWVQIVSVALLVTVGESLSVYGLDNLVMPLIVIIVLR